MGAKLVLYPLALVGMIYAGGQAYTAATGHSPALPWSSGKDAGKGEGLRPAHASTRSNDADDGGRRAEDRQRTAEPESRSVSAETAEGEHKKGRKQHEEAAQKAEQSASGPTPSTEMRSVMPGGRPLTAEPDPASSPAPAGLVEPKLEVTPVRGAGAAPEGLPDDGVHVRSLTGALQDAAAGAPGKPAGKPGPAGGGLSPMGLRRGALPPIAGPARPELPKPGGSAAALPPLEIAKGEGRRREVALTFDAGADYRPAQKILDTLKSQGLQCTFFLTGEWVQKNPRTARRIAEEGHEIGNHSWNHPAFTTLSDTEIKDQLERTEAIIEQTTGKSSRPYFRPPLGARDMRVRRVVGADGFYTVYWTLDSHDSVIKGITAEQVRDRVLEKATPGSIILLHCGSQASADALSEIIGGLKAKGLTPVSVSHLLSE